MGKEKRREGGREREVQEKIGAEMSGYATSCHDSVTVDTLRHSRSSKPANVMQALFDVFA